MSMIEWAKREVELACKSEKGSVQEEWADRNACYERALEIFINLCDDSGKYTGCILNRLVEGIPLTPIEDTEDIWEDVTKISVTPDGCKLYQCKRLSSLFKGVDKDGQVVYRDNNRYIGYDINDDTDGWSSGLLARIVNEVCPIKMPYTPSVKPIKIYFEEFVVDPKNGDFDTVGILYLIKPDGERIDINRRFKFVGDAGIEITRNEYNDRWKNRYQGNENK